MATTIRLTRVGSKGAPRYRVVVTDSRSPRDGRFVEIIGHYNPTAEPVVIKVDEDKALNWLRQGAQPSDTVRGLFRKLGIMKKFRQGSEPAATAAEAEE